MKFSLKKTLVDGTRQFREHPQLLLTVVVATAIVVSFVFVSDRFLGIARDAQDKLTEVRIGSLQDAFAPLAAELWDQPDVLREYMKRMAVLNSTIVDFEIAKEVSPKEWHILLSAKPELEGQQLFRQDLLLSLAQSDTANSFTVQQAEGSTRFFYTARAVVSRDGSLLGVVITRQTLSAADAALSDSMRNAIVMLVVILLFLLLLFFRHARIIDYTILYKKLSEVDSLKDEFIAMASHELRAPLTAIRGYADILKDESLAAPMRTQSVERIDISARQLDSLIADMLDVSRIEQGRMSIKPERVNAVSVVDELCDMWEVQAKAKGVAIVRDLAPELYISVDPNRFRQVVINLLSNAVKYTNTGTITVSAQGDKEFTLRVSDSGIGMTNEEREGLFKKFYRVDTAEVHKQTGTGLGLWITKQIVELMGGHITVESIKGVGSHFIVTFPFA